MRNTLPLMIAVALTAAAPAAAQGTDNTVNADTNAAAVSNDMATTGNVANNSAMMANDMTAAPATEQPIEATTEPAPAKKGGFPWGVLGLLGLVGLIGRRKG